MREREIERERERSRASKRASERAREREREREREESSGIFPLTPSGFNVRNPLVKVGRVKFCRTYEGIVFCRTYEGIVWTQGGSIGLALL